MERFLGSAAVVTGASAGIGKTICKELLKKGLTVVGLARSLDKLRELEQEVLKDKKMYTGKFNFIKCDISKEQEVKDAFEQIKSKIGAVGILINNAGVTCTQPLDDAGTNTLLENYNKIFDTNIKGLLLCSKEALKSMNDSGIDGHIINMNSCAGERLGEPSVLRHSIMYAASKRAVKVLSEGLRRELLMQKKAIKVTDVYPAAVETELAAGYIKQRKLEPNQYLQTADIASACMYVLSTPPNVLVSEITVRAVFEIYY